MNIPDHIQSAPIAETLRRLSDDELAALFVSAIGGVEVFEALRYRANSKDVSNRQLAEWLGVPESTLRSWLNRARVKARCMGLEGILDFIPADEHPRHAAQCP